MQDRATYFFMIVSGKDKKECGETCVLLFTYVKCENQKGEGRGREEEVERERERRETTKEMNPTPPQTA